MRPCSTLGQRASCSELSFRCAVSQTLPMRQTRHSGAAILRMLQNDSFRGPQTSDCHQIKEVSSNAPLSPTPL